MEESSYKHNYEYLSIEEAKSIINGTFVQGTTNIGGELATKSNIDKLLTAADKRLTSMVPSTVASNEFVCFFECINNEDFPDDLEHRWIEITPRQFMFPANGGSVNITGSYGLTGTLGTRKKVGDITDTITVEENNTESSKSGSKTYYYNNDQSQQPTINFSWTQPNKDEEFPDDEAHRWIEITPTNAGNFTEAGGTITVTGSYGLTGSFGTKKTVGYINDTITVEKNTTTQTKSGSKTYYYNNSPDTVPSATVAWTQDAHIEKFTYEYHIYVGQKADTVRQKFMQLVWQCDQYNRSSKKTVFVGAYKSKINEQNQVVSNIAVEFGIKDSNLFDKFVTIDNENGTIYCFPTSNNLSYYYTNFGSFTLYVKESENVTCKVNLIQEKKDVQVIPGDAVKFEYSWDNSQQSERCELFQATTVGLNNPNESYKDYCGYFSGQFPEYKNITHWLGTDPGKPEGEHVLIEFGSIDNYLKEHGNNQSSIAGKTILESLTDNNGVITATCNAYTNWWGKKSENITLSYIVYHKDSEDASVKKENNTFVLTGYSTIKSTSDQALCFAAGSNNSVNHYYKVGPTRTYTLSAKFTYYLNSGIFALQTNKDNVGKWQKGLVWSASTSTPSCSNVNFKNDGVNIIFSANIDSLHQPDNINKNLGVTYTIGSAYGNISKEISNIKISDIPHKIAVNTPLGDVVKKIDFKEENSVIMSPNLKLNTILDYDIPLELNFNTVYFKNQITVYKPR